MEHSLNNSILKEERAPEESCVTSSNPQGKLLTRDRDTRYRNMQHPKHDNNNNGKRIEKSKRTRWGVRWQNNLTLGMVSPTWHTERGTREHTWRSIHIINTNRWEGGCIVLDGYLKYGGWKAIFKVRQMDNWCQQGHVGCWLRCTEKQKHFITVWTGNDPTASGYFNSLDVLLEKLSPLFSLDGNLFDICCSCRWNLEHDGLLSSHVGFPPALLSCEIHTLQWEAGRAQLCMWQADRHQTLLCCSHISTYTTQTVTLVIVSHMSQSILWWCYFSCCHRM